VTPAQLVKAGWVKSGTGAYASYSKGDYRIEKSSGMVGGYNAYHLGDGEGYGSSIGGRKAKSLTQRDTLDSAFKAVEAHGPTQYTDRFDVDTMREQEARARGRVEVIAHTSPHYKTRTAEEVGAMSEEEALQLIRDNDATGRRILDKGIEVKHGDVVGVRANLNVKKTTGITVQTMHKGTQDQLDKGTGMFSGEAIGYAASVKLQNVNFSVNQSARAKILSGEANKFPMASVDGQFQAFDPTDKYNLNRHRFDGVEITFNPMKSHLFIDPDGRPVKSASQVTVVGSKVFARGKITYYTPENMPKPARGLPTEARP
jgi:hypothetical protein